MDVDGPGPKSGKDWKEGQEVQIFDRAKKKWMDGKIMEIFKDDEGDWVMVKYGRKTQEVHPDDADLRDKTVLSDKAEKGLKDLKLRTIGRQQSSANVHAKSSKRDGGGITMFDNNKPSMMIGGGLAMFDEEFNEDDELEFFESESSDDDLAALAQMGQVNLPTPSVNVQVPFKIRKRPMDDSSDEESMPVPHASSPGDDMKSDSSGIATPTVDDLVPNAPEKDHFEHMFFNEGMDRFVILFHGDTFSLPKQCAVSKKEVQLLATTDKYNQLFKVGKYTYGFQGHPELTYDMLSVWCKCWGDEFLAKWSKDTGGDLERDVIQYAAKNDQRVKNVGAAVFDTWCKQCVVAHIREKERGLFAQGMTVNGPKRKRSL